MKRMYANEELVKLIQENAPEVEVDDALSNTSENPVQNKVIYGALEDKQDALPDTTGETGKFLKVGSDGLEWDEAGGNAYQHIISFNGSKSGVVIELTVKFDLINSNATPFTNSSLASYLYDKGYTSSSNGLKANFNGTFYSPTTSTNYFGYYTVSNIYSSNGSTLSAYSDDELFTFTINDGAIKVVRGNSGGFITISSITDKVIAL